MSKMWKWKKKWKEEIGKENTMLILETNSTRVTRGNLDNFFKNNFLSLFSFEDWKIFSFFLSFFFMFSFFFLNDILFNAIIC